MKYLFALGLTFCITSGLSQAQVKTLSIGDTLPDIILRKLYNDGASGRSIRSLSKKLLIIDLFATWCAPCVEALPKIDSLNEEFKGDLLILPVSDEPFQTVQQMMVSNPLRKKSKVKIVTDDTLMNKWFPHTMVPHEIWVNSRGIIVAITSHLELTESNIQKFMREETLDLPQKKDETNFDLGKPIVKHQWFNRAIIADSSIVNYSILLKHKAGLPASGYVTGYDFEKLLQDPNHSFYINGITLTNHRALSLLIASFDLSFTYILTGYLNPNRIILDVKDSFQYMETADIYSGYYTDSFSSTHAYNYELKIDKQVVDSVFWKLMLADLNRFFPLKGKVVKRPQTCWIIVKKDNRAEAMGAVNGVPNVYVTGEAIGIKKKNINVLAKLLNAFYDMEPVFNESGIDWPVDMDVRFKADFNYHPDMAALKKSLNEYGLDVIQQERIVDKLYLTDKPENY